MRTGYSQWLDTFRWLAALAVLVAHVSGRIPVERDIFGLGLQFAAGFSHQAVMVFFVLSGFLVGGTALNELQRTGDIDLRTYFTKRLVRLWLVLIPTLLLGAVIDPAGMFGLHGLDKGVYTAREAARLDPATLACNLVFLQTLACQQYGSNGSLWSLCNEFWYYVLWPLFLIAAMSRRRTRDRIVAGLLVIGLGSAISLTQFDGYPVIPYMGVWFMGAWASQQPRALLVRSPLLNAAVLAATLAAIRVGIVDEESKRVLLFVLDLVVGAAFANLLVSLKTVQAGPPGGRLNADLAGFSFSLYCLHVPLVQLIRSATTGAQPWLVVGACIAVPIGAAFLFSLVTERRTDRVRRALAAWRRTAPSA